MAPRTASKDGAMGSQEPESASFRKQSKRMCRLGGAPDCGSSGTASARKVDMNNGKIENNVIAADANGGISAHSAQDNNQGQERVSAEGVSNTPVIPYKAITVCIDYLKVVFPYPYEEYEPEIRAWWDSVLNALYVDYETRVDMRRGGSNYELGWYYNETVYVFTGGELTKTKEGLSTSMLELKGQGCEKFLQRVVDAAQDKANHILEADEIERIEAEAWRNLFKVIKSLPHRCTRIDLTVDDWNGNVPIAEMMLKCKKREFVSSMKKGFGSGGVPLDFTDDEEDAVIRGGLGWSFTLGKTESERQLCIYDKRAEWVNGKKGTVNADTWIRFESRFKANRADFMLDAFIDKMADSADPVTTFREFIIGALSSVIEFKEGRMNGENTYKLETWKPWAEFIKNGVLPPKYKAKKDVPTIRKNALWEKRDVSRCNFRLRMAHKEEIDDVNAYLFAEGMRKADGDDLAIINADRVSRGLEPYASVEQLKEEGAKLLPGDGSISESVIALFDDKIEAGLVPIERKPEEGGNQ